MKEISQVKAKDIMSRKLVSIDKSEPLKNAISTLNREKIHHLVVYDKNAYSGIFGYRELTRLHTRPPGNTKIDDFTFRPPVIPEDTGIIDIVEQMYRLNYKVLPVGDGRKIMGIISESDVLRTVLDFSILSNKKAIEFMTPNPITISEDESLGKALALLRDESISRIPVVDKSNKFAGILESTEVLREITTKEQYGRDSGTHIFSSYIKPTAYISDLKSDHEIPVKSILSTNTITSRPDDMIAAKIKEGINLDTSTITVIDANRHPIGIISPKDIIHFLASLKERESVLIQISGLESMGTIDAFEKKEMHSIIDRAVRKISKITEPSNFTIHAKAYHVDGSRTKYAFRCKFSTRFGPVFARNWGWDPIDTLSKLTEEAEKMVIGMSKKTRDTLRSKNRETKYSS